MYSDWLSLDDMTDVMLVLWVHIILGRRKMGMRECCGLVPVDLRVTGAQSSFHHSALMYVWYSL